MIRNEVQQVFCILFPYLLNITLMEVIPPQTTNKNIFTLPLRRDGPLITVSSQFDSGNMLKAEIGLNNALVITPANDCVSTQNPSHSKGWFYFSVTGVPIHTKVKIIVKRVSPLSSQVFVVLPSQNLAIIIGQYSKQQAMIGNEWNKPLFSSQTKQEDTQLHFDFTFSKNVEFYFAYSFPFSYEDCEKMLRNSQREARLFKSIYYKDEIMIKTSQGRNVHLLTLTSNDDRLDIKEDKISEYLFNYGQRPQQFKSSKRIIMVTARVHPGESPSSHTFNGLLRFLLSNDARAYYLRKNFVFKMVPMLNPDGVSQGHHRMDLFGQNLNRFYIDPIVDKQPSVFGVKKLGQYYHKMSNLCFYIDLHAHPQKKGNFIYGNSMENSQEQAQTQLFARLLSLNCIEFDYFNSSFSKYHMNAKDKNQDLSKEGCGRVVFNTHFQMPYTYTMQCGYTSSVYLNEICQIENSHRKFQKYSIISDELQNLKSSYYNGKKSVYFTIRSYENLGKNILVSILDLFELNPASRIPNTSMKNLIGIKQEIMEHMNKTSMTYNNKLIRNPVTQGNIKPLRHLGLLNEKNQKKYLIRAPSIESSKEICFNKLRNKTLAKVNIGGF